MSATITCPNCCHRINLLDMDEPCKTVLESRGEREAWDRSKILAEAKKCVCGERERDYGSPEDSFGLIGDLWSAYLGVEISPTNVAVLMALLKIARLAEAPTHMDSWVDLAGYAACGGEISDKKKEDRT